MPSFGPTELLIILGIVILIFGASRLPEIGRGLGQSIQGFRKAMKDDDSREKDRALKTVREVGED